jgi:hypothetical protein
MTYNTNVSIPVQKVRAFIRALLVNGGHLGNENGTWRLTSFTIPGLNANATYQSEDQAIDAVLGAQFPEAMSKAA